MTCLTHLQRLEAVAEARDRPEINIRTVETSAEDAVEKIVAYLPDGTVEHG